MCNLNSQKAFPDNGRVFNNSEVPRIDIQMDQDDLDMMLEQENWFKDDLYQAQFKWIDEEGERVLDNVGIRLRGNTSRSSGKKSFKIKFKAFDGEEFYGLSDLNLNGEHNDPSIVRANLAFDLFAKASVISPRTNLVELYINNEFRGVYANIEHIDKDFLNERFNDPSGNLYKMYYGCDLSYRGEDSEEYKYSLNGRDRVYELKTNIEEDNYNSLASFISILNDPTDPEFQCKLEKVFDVHSYLRAMAMEVIIGHWDNPTFNKNNGYLYDDPESGKFLYIPFDVDNTFGIDWFGIDWTTRDCYNWAATWEERPLYENIIAIDEYRDWYSEYLYRFNNQFLKDFDEEAYDYRDRISHLVQQDDYYSASYGFTHQDFLNSFDDVVAANHVKNSLIGYVSQRSIFLDQNIQISQTTPWIANVGELPKDDELKITCQLLAESIQNLTLNYQSDNGDWIEKNCSLVQTKGDTSFFEVVVEIENTQTIKYFLSVVSEDIELTRWPRCDSEFLLTYSSDKQHVVVINEWMSSNSNSYADEKGEFDDWIEIYNAGDEEVDLQRYYLTDNLSIPEKWKMPSYNLLPDRYLIVWADRDEEQGEFHANFKLDKGGEQIGLFWKENDVFHTVDTVSYQQMDMDKTKGRYPNGIGEFIDLSVPTPGSNNTGLSDTGEEILISRNMFPNPTNGRIFINDLKEVKRIEVYSSEGKKVLSILLDNAKQIDLSPLPSGLYYLKTNVANIPIVKL